MMNASVAPPLKPNGLVDLCFAMGDAPVVFTVRTVDPLPFAAILTITGFRLQLGTLCAPAGDPTNHLRKSEKMIGEHLREEYA
jgi:hypothetical protein